MVEKGKVRSGEVKPSRVKQMKKIVEGERVI